MEDKKVVLFKKTVVSSEKGMSSPEHRIYIEIIF